MLRKILGGHEIIYREDWKGRLLAADDNGHEIKWIDVTDWTAKKLYIWLGY